MVAVLGTPCAIPPCNSNLLRNIHLKVATALLAETFQKLTVDIAYPQNLKLYM
jgi:hypothetical protein